VNTPGFTATDEEGWGRERISKCLYLMGDCEGLDQLADFALDDMREGGWCESELEPMLLPGYMVGSLLDRPRIKDHSGCGKILCCAYQTDETTYQTRHTEDECCCEFAEVQTTILVNVLAAGKVPLVIITDQLELEVVASDVYPYIALSHVCMSSLRTLIVILSLTSNLGADGLGNPNANALPKCQLRRLRAYINELYRIHDPSQWAHGRPVGFWMDTLCIPVAQSAKQYRREAIQLLGKTFKEASAALVLDRELEIVESFTASFMEVGLRIACSGWIKRLWTLQEASLSSEAHDAEKIYFQMADGPFLYQRYDPNRKLAWAMEKETTEISSEERTLLGDFGVMLELGARIPSVRTMRAKHEFRPSFYAIYSAIEYRSTSKPEDVPVCIASLMGLDLSAILSATTAEQRMATFYMTMQEIPSGVVWRHEPQKLNIPGFRWALTSITACNQNAYHGWESASCDPDGLHIRMAGFIFSHDDGNEPTPDEATLPRMTTILAEQTGAELQLHQFDPDSPDIPLYRNLALIFKPRDKMDEPPNSAVVVVEGTVERGEETEFVCKIVGLAHAVRSRQACDRVFRGNLTAPKQRWCIT